MLASKGCKEGVGCESGAYSHRVDGCVRLKQ